SGDLLAEVETDKATMDLESYGDGTILYIGPKDGEAVAIDAIIAIVGEEGEDYQSLLDGDAAPAKEEKAEEPAADAAPEDEADDASDVTPEDLDCTVITMPLLSDTMTE